MIITFTKEVAKKVTQKSGTIVARSPTNTGPYQVITTFRKKVAKEKVSQRE